jgi:hypothetical protein
LSVSTNDVIGALVTGLANDVDERQVRAWQVEILLLRDALNTFGHRGWIFLEFSIPRLGRRIDALIVIDGVIFVIEFKVGDRAYEKSALDQVSDYALDLKNFHATSHDECVIPVLTPTGAVAAELRFSEWMHRPGLFQPVRCAPSQLAHMLEKGASLRPGRSIAPEAWDAGQYSPTPTIVEAAMALYAKHGVVAISRHDATGAGLKKTTKAVEDVVAACREQNRKAICFVTGVPGAGKTLVGLNIATKYAKKGVLHSVFLSGNGPLVAVLREALVRDKVRREKERGRRVTKKETSSEVNAFIQNVHHFRDEYLDESRIPSDHIAVFDEAQRAWDFAKTRRFMADKRQKPDFAMSESEFLISCLDRHNDWAVIVCLVGSGQEIYKGEAGIAEWLRALHRSFRHWEVHVSPHLLGEDAGTAEVLTQLNSDGRVQQEPALHLSMSMRSFRAEHVSAFVRQLLDIDSFGARQTLSKLGERFPIRLTRDLARAKEWVRQNAIGSEKVGLMVSSRALRLKPLAIDVRASADPVLWFLNGKEDTRSCYYLEDAATEFDVQGLEVDWACVVWDGDFRMLASEWRHHFFRGDKWCRLNKMDDQTYLKNAYRVLLTRARQGMVIVVPEGCATDPTRAPSVYDSTFKYLEGIGLRTI